MTPEQLLAKLDAASDGAVNAALVVLIHNPTLRLGCEVINAHDKDRVQKLKETFDLFEIKKIVGLLVERNKDDKRGPICPETFDEFVGNAYAAYAMNLAQEAFARRAFGQ